MLIQTIRLTVVTNPPGLLVEALGRKQEITLPALRRLRSIKLALPEMLRSFRQAIGVRGGILNERDAHQAMTDLDLCAAAIADEMIQGSEFETVDAFETAMAEIISPALRLAGAEQVPMIEIVEPEGADALTDLELSGLLPAELLRFAGLPVAGGLNAPRGERLGRYLGMRAVTVRRYRGALNGDLIGTGQVPVAVLAYDGFRLKGPAAQVDFLRSKPAVFAGRFWPEGHSFPINDLSLSAVKPYQESALAQSLIGEILEVIGMGGSKQPAYRGCIVHMCCHYYTTKVPECDQAAPFLSFDDQRKNISVYALRGALASVPALTGSGQHPSTRYSQALVVLNACETAATAPFTDGILQLLFSRGFRHIIASETLIPDALSSAFSERFYTALMDQKTVGESLLRARKLLVDDYRNPGGLLYTMYGDPTLRLATEPELATPRLA